MLDGPRRDAAEAPARQLVVLLHGYGADGGDLVPLTDEWSGALPHAAFAAPDAPEPHPALAVGRQWFRLVEASLDLTDARLVAAVSAAAEAVNAFADAELVRLSLPSDAVAFAGFSQGATVALEAGLSRPLGCAGVLAYSGALAGGRVPSLAGPPPPVFLRHGEQDNVVPPVLMQIAAKSLGAAGITTDAQLVPGLEHGIDAGGVDAGAAFLAGLFGAVG